MLYCSVFFCAVKRDFFGYGYTVISPVVYKAQHRAVGRISAYRLAAYHCAVAAKLAAAQNILPFGGRYFAEKAPV